LVPLFALCFGFGSIIAIGALSLIAPDALKSLPSIVGAFGIGLILASLVFHLFSRWLIDIPLERVLERVNRLAEGDLSDRSDAPRGIPAIKSIAKELDEVLAGNYQVILIGLRDLTARNIDSARTFSEEVRGAANSLEDARAPISAIGTRVAELSKRVSAAAAEAATMDGSISDLSRRVADQASAVEETSAAIEETSAQIRNIASTAAREQDAANKLAQIAEEGQGRVDAASAMIGELNDGIAEIGELSKMINSVAARTNLLAMNAAIEAAHAGQYGAGFAVVAEEIRGLAESSGRSAKQIAEALKAFGERTRGVSSANGQLREAFDRVRRELEKFLGAFGAISDSTGEIAQGTIQMLEGVDELRKISTENRDAFGEMGRSVSEIEGAFSQTAEFASDLDSQSVSMTTAFTEAANRVASLGTRGEETARSFAEIGTELRYFALDKTEHGGAYHPTIKRIIFDHKRRVVNGRLLLDDRIPLDNLPKPCKADECPLHPLIASISKRLPERAAMFDELSQAHFAFHDSYNSFCAACSNGTPKEKRSALLRETEKRWERLLDYREEINLIVQSLKE
jgi:methyl-accepting chemotaxis protein